MGLKQILVLALITISALTKTLLDVEIDTTEQLIKLYESKAVILEELNSQNSTEDSTVDLIQFNQLLKRQEDSLKKRHFKLNDLIGFEDPFEESFTLKKSISDDQKEYEKHRVKLESLFHERLLFDEITRNITHHELMNIKPLTKASSGGLITQAVLLGIDSEDIYLYDMYKNLLFNISMKEHGGIKLLQGSQHNDDMYIVALSHTNQLWEFNLTLLRNFETNPRKNRSPAEIKKELHPVNQTKALETGREDLFNKKYRGLLKMYSYIIEGQSWINLTEHANATSADLDFKEIMFYMNRGEKYYLITDSDGYINSFKRGLTPYSRFYTGEKEIIQILKKSVTIIIVHKNDIRFVKFFKSSMSTKRCHSGMAELSSVVIDSNFHGFIFGSTLSGEILMFKTDKLLQNPDNIEWTLQGKLKVQLHDNGNTHIGIASLNNYLLASKSDGIIEMFDMTNLNEFLSRPIGYNVRLPFSRFELEPNYMPQLKTLKSFNGDLILMNLPISSSFSKVVFYEWLTPRAKDASDEDSFSFRFPMFFIAFAIVLVFQFMRKGDGEDDDIVSMFLRWFGWRDQPTTKKFKNKKEKEMHELEEMVKKFTERNSSAVDKLGMNTLGRKNK